MNPQWRSAGNRSERSMRIVQPSPIVRVAKPTHEPANPYCTPTTLPVTRLKDSILFLCTDKADSTRVVEETIPSKIIIVDVVMVVDGF